MIGCQNKPKMNMTDVAIPCGLFAKSFFNDTFLLYRDSQDSRELINVSDKGIAWKSDVEKAFKNIQKDQNGNDIDW